MAYCHSREVHTSVRPLTPFKVLDALLMCSIKDRNACFQAIRLKYNNLCYHSRCGTHYL